MRVMTLAVVAGLHACHTTAPPPPQHRAASEPRGNVMGRVTLDGEPVSELAVMFVEDELPEPRLVRDPHGRFEFDVPPGEYELIIVGDTFSRHISSRTIVKGRRHDLGEIAVRRGFTIEGTVTDASNQPVAGAGVTISQRHGREMQRATNEHAARAQGTFAATTDHAGRFRIRGVTVLDVGGMMTISASKPGTGATLPRKLSADDQRVDFALQPTGQIRGTTSHRGIVMALSRQPLSMITAAVRSNGTFVLDVPAGAYDLKVASYQQQVVVVIGQTVAVAFP